MPLMPGLVFTAPSVLDAAARTLLGTEDIEIDFGVPPGEPALVAADSISWRVFKNPVSLFVGGVAAVLMEFAEPLVRDGVWQHSSFRTDPLTRLRRTGLAAMITIYGAARQAKAMIAGVNRAHDRVRGTTSGGKPYHALDPDLLNWVQATASFGFIYAYDRYVRRLGPARIDRTFAEARPVAALYGADTAPTRRAEFDAVTDRLLPGFESSPIVDEFLKTMRSVPVLPGPLRPLQRPLVRAAVDMLPPRIATILDLDARWRPLPGEAHLVKAAGAAADRIVLPSAPPAQACRRLGLPADYLYRTNPH